MKNPQQILRACRKEAQRVVILVDEYDKPIMQAIGNEELRKSFRNTLKVKATFLTK